MKAELLVLALLPATSAGAGLALPAAASPASTSASREPARAPAREVRVAGADRELFVAAAAADAADAADGGELERYLVGILVRGRELGGLEAIRQGEEFALPLVPLADLLGATLVTRDGREHLMTPLGGVELDTEDLIEVDGARFLRQRAVEKKLATPIDFDAERFALVLDLPWRPGDAIETDESVELAEPEPAAAAWPVPDVTPAAASLSTLRANVGFARRGDAETATSTTTLAGRVAEGWWRLRYDENFAGSRELREYSWLRTAGRRRFLVGQQRSSLHPLLGSLELTGIQVAATNQPLELFSTRPEYGQLLSRRHQPLTDLRGTGPPAGLAELRLDGETVSQQVIGLDGVYEFFDVELPARGASRVEVLLFDRHNLAVPVAIEERVVSASDLLLPDGAMVQLAAAGRDGNYLQDPDAGGRAVGYYQWRHGVTPNLTLEAAAQQGETNRQAMGGLVARLGTNTVMAASVGRSEDGGGYDFTSESRWSRWSRRRRDGQRDRQRQRQQQRWHFLARSRLLEPDFLAPGSRRYSAHDFELGRRSERLDLALIGRRARNDGKRDEFLLPAVGWRPLTSLYFRARPDQTGDYRYDLAYRFAPRARLGVSYQDAASVDLTYRFLGRYYLLLNSELGRGAAPDRHSAVVRWFGGGHWQPTWSVGAVDSGAEIGYLAGLTAQLRDGIRARLELQDSGAPGGLRITASLTADLAFARGRVVSGRHGAVRDDRGAIAGRVRVDGPWRGRGERFAGLKVFVDGRLATETESGGDFFIGGLSPGTYRVEIDAENLPIELNPGATSFIAQVAAAAVTRVGFTVRPEYGLAGRVVGVNGEPAAAMTVEVLDAAGQRLQTATTDRFGLYRVDGLSPGPYRVRVVGVASSATGAERAVEVFDDFLFGQDLFLPAGANRM